MTNAGKAAMNLHQLRAVQIVFELGSVTAAANRLGLTQSAVSRIINAVEAELGLTLFERYRRRLIPSQHAVQFVDRAAQIVSSMQELEASARALKLGRIERLRIVSVPPFLQTILPRVVARRLNANPQLSVRIDVARRVDTPDWINRRDFDIGIVGLPIDRPEVNVQPLPPVEAVAVVPRGHKLATRRKIRLRDILNGPLVTHSTGPLFRSELDRVLARRGTAPAPVVEASTGWLVCAMVRADAGVAVMDPFTALATANSGLVVRRLSEKIILRYGILTLRERPVLGEAAILVKEIYREVQNHIKAQ
jgi:DNA-binding transcriptional LysR family regulator